MSRLPTLQRKTESSYTKTVAPRTSAGPSASSTRITAQSKQAVKPGGKKQIGAVKATDPIVKQPTYLQKKIFTQALTKSSQDPGKKVRATGMSKTKLPDVPKVMTKRGKECVVQQMITETTVQRTPKAEYIGKTLIGLDVGPSGARKIEMSSAQIDPTFATESAGVNEAITVTSSLSVTAGGKQKITSYRKKTIISQKLKDKPNMNPNHINRLVKEETEDIENTLRMVPPDLVSGSIEKYPVKRKLQSLRLSAEPVSILTQSVIHPTRTADEMDAEAPPETIAEVIEAVEKGATPDSAPNQIFNSLFPEVKEPRIQISSIAPGPLEDIVVPTDKPLKLFEEVLTHEMEEFISKEIQNNPELPKDCICVEQNVTAAERASKAEGKAPDLIEGELPPWEDATVNKISNIVGGNPMYDLEALDYSTLESPQDISQELSKGIDYFVDADVTPYENKVQLRGSKMPTWFPGYMSAFPHLPELVQITKTPSEVLHTAWKAVQPKVFPEESLLIL